ncbi:alpha/beta hydrolase [Fictibacillus fluitans]|uniref:Alpha/beta hydrolase-fold protein n=1 Tax=Fictibacillus fluitans TaxID=3058422 RepID=A0ABT8HTK1_9BACL|nr:alpha/beta hydrolase-fold protein [Fictibacillus sp. NE201]MDN4523607.1 alpha/beta hydrolase-fold protein [Fictibacillus sp. NE201]
MMPFKGTIEEQTLHSQELNEKVPLLVYYPPVYTTLKKYPVLIAQDGPDYFQLGRLASTADELIQSGDIEPMIIIGIAHQRGDDRHQKYHPIGSKHSSYLRFMSNELPAYINQEFNTYLLGSGICLIGDSLGGYVSLMCGLRYPRTFGQLILQSPFVDSNVLEILHSFTGYELLKLYHSVGTEEAKFKSPSGVKDFLTPNRQLFRMLETKNFEYQYEEFQGNHLWSDWQKNLVPALKFIYGK